MYYYNNETKVSSWQKPDELKTNAEVRRERERERERERRKERKTEEWGGGEMCMYCIAGKFGGLAVDVTTAELKSAKISYLHTYVWRFHTEPPNLNPLIFLQ